MADFVSVIIPSAGRGKRMNSEISKQYIEIHNKPVLAHTIQKFDQMAEINEIVIVVSAGECDYVLKEVVKKYGFKKVTQIVEGGKERQDSVYNGLKALNSQCNYVLIHDAARPLVTPPDILRIIETVKSKKSCVLGVQVKDTIKKVDENLQITETPRRDQLYIIQTPQAFDKLILSNAYEAGISKGLIVTDDAMMVELTLNLPSYVVQGSYLNIKLTTEEDLIFMNHYLE